MVENHRSFILEMNEVFMLFGKQFSKITLQTDLSPGKYWFLMYLYRKDKATVNDLSNETCTTSGATSLAIKSLEKSGHVERIRDKEDRRVVWVSLTKKGRETVEQISQKRAKICQQLLENLTDTEKEIFLLIMKKMLTSQNTLHEGEKNR
ncbi:MarR family transcriptional regulator [Shimazuella sp. AN120528]|uniref:MarR family winged helix-turn-helix transcriptional regulator n=1 Tax=Shimazuella soli TaxID=1892854 RepID=UPI001F0F4E1F|nr:MarR family transcriptional regulator [Shimazuella soli]MCH5584403.1 MarR family transcriptional regulator [Shimazuella soli]